MNDITRIALINKEIETYRKFAQVLESLKPVINTFDGKCINKKLTEAMDEFLNSNTPNRSYRVSAVIDTGTYGNMFHLELHCYDDVVKGEPDSYGYCGCYYISNRDITMRINADEVTTLTTANGKPRLQAKALFKKLDEKIQHLHNQVKELEKDLSKVDEMRTDLEHIKQLMSVYNSKYSGRIKEVFNCNYFLRDNNGMQYR